MNCADKEPIPKKSPPLQKKWNNLWGKRREKIVGGGPFFTDLALQVSRKWDPWVPRSQTNSNLTDKSERKSCINKYKSGWGLSTIVIVTDCLLQKQTVCDTQRVCDRHRLSVTETDSLWRTQTSLQICLYITFILDFHGQYIGHIILVLWSRTT